MESLLEALAMYADENLIGHYEQENSLSMRAARHRVDVLSDRLEALGPEAKKLVEELRKKLLYIDFNNEQAALRAGISIGLELGRL